MMKEIDFLPDWYKRDKRQRFRYHSQYIVLAVAFLVMSAWTVKSLSAFLKANAKLTSMQEVNKNLDQNLLNTPKLSVLRSEMDLLSAFSIERKPYNNVESQNDLIEYDRNYINVANVLAELSFLADQYIVLTKVEIKAKTIVEDDKNTPQQFSTVRAARKKPSNKGTALLEDVEYNIIIAGLAADASDVAHFICNLEDSQFFAQAIPAYSKSKEVSPAGNLNNKKYQVNEFEVRCLLSNYVRQITGFAKNNIKK